MRTRLLLVLLLLVPASALLSGGACGPSKCSNDDECNGNLVCVEETCAQPCAADIRCPQGQACVARDDGSFEGACLAITGTFLLGEECSGDRDCTSGACAGEEGTRVCVELCDVGTGPAAECDEGANAANERCTLEGLRRVCVPPLDDFASGEPCNSPRECASGTCIVPPAREVEDAVCAENCSDAVPCSNDGDLCVRLTGGARACLAPLEDGATCQDDAVCSGGFCIKDVDDSFKCASPCDDGACAAGFGCDVDERGNRVCMPVLDDRVAGEECARARECASGHCARFATPDQDFGTLCADPCDDGECTSPLVCWPDPDGTDVCGPNPN